MLHEIGVLDMVKFALLVVSLASILSNHPAINAASSPRCTKTASGYLRTLGLASAPLYRPPNRDEFGQVREFSFSYPASNITVDEITESCKIEKILIVPTSRKFEIVLNHPTKNIFKMRLRVVAHGLAADVEGSSRSEREIFSSQRTPIAILFFSGAPHLYFGGDQVGGQDVGVSTLGGKPFFFLVNWPQPAIGFHPPFWPGLP